MQSEGFLASKRFALRRRCRPTNVALLAPFAAVGGGMGRIMVYLANSEAADAASVRFYRIETRGGGRVAVSPVFVALAAMRIAVLAISGRTLVHANVAEGASILRKGLLLWWAGVIGCPTVLHLHAAQIIGQYSDSGRLGKRIIRHIFRRASLCIVLGVVWRRWLVEELGVPEHRVAVVRNGVPQISRRMASPAAERRDLVFVGNLLARKGLNDLLVTLARPDVIELPWHLTVAGGGDDAPYRQLSAALAIADRVTFLGWLEADAVGELLAKSDALVLPSYHEALPLVLLEALAAGLPVIATAVGAIPEVLVHDQTALLVVPGDLDELALTVRRLILENGLSTRLAIAGGIVFTRELTLERFASRILELYRLHCGFDTRHSRV